MEKQSPMIEAGGVREIELQKIVRPDVKFKVSFMSQTNTLRIL